MSTREKKFRELLLKATESTDPAQRKKLERQLAEELEAAKKPLQIASSQATVLKSPKPSANLPPLPRSAVEEPSLLAGAVLGIQRSAGGAPKDDKLLEEVRRTNWLLEGPDDYDPIEDTMVTTEKHYKYGPSFVVWAIKVTNNAASGGPNILMRLNDSYGMTKQIKVSAGSTLAIGDIKGGWGSQVHVMTDSLSASMSAVVSLKLPFRRK